MYNYSDADVTCGALRNITNGYVTNPTNRSEGFLASYGCDEEYILQGYGTRTCQSDGTWSRDEPRCRRYCKLEFNIHLTAKVSEIEYIHTIILIQMCTAYNPGMTVKLSTKVINISL